jgi:phage terminase large subunit-like protein
MGLRGRGARPIKKTDKKPGHDAQPMFVGFRSDQGDRAKARAARPKWKRRGLSRADRVIAFLEELPITKGILVGTKMRLLPDQVAFVRKVYRDDGVPRIGIDSKPRGQGKTGLCAGLALSHLLGPESEPRGEVYSAAVDRTQSAKMFAEIEAIILAVPAFAAVCNIQRFAKKIEVLSGDGAGSIFEALSGDARKGHGLAPSLWIYDELAQVTDFELLDNLETGMGKRDRTLGLIISTQAESDEHRLSIMIDDGLDGVDPGIVVHLLAAPADADAFDEAVLRSVNPALGVYLNEKDVLADLHKAKRIPAYEPRYRNRRLNQRVDSNAENRIVTAAVWKLGNAPVDRAALRGRTAFGGLDLSGKHDLTALVLAFPTDDPEPIYDVLPLFWTPEGQLEARQARERDNFKTWIAAGHLTATPGPTIRSGWVAAEIARLGAEFNIRGISYDRWRADDLKIDLDDADCSVPLVPRGQGFKDAGPDIEVLAELALTGRLRHGGHPVLRAAMAGAITITDPAGNFKIDKDASARRGPVRVDGAVALAMALGLASRTPPPKVSVYRTRGVVAIDLTAER